MLRERALSAPVRLFLGLCLCVAILAPVLILTGGIFARKKQQRRPAPVRVVDVRVAERPLTAAEARAYVGDAACARCHALIAQEQLKSRHASTLRAISLAQDGPHFRRSNLVDDPLRDYVYQSLVRNGRCLIGAHAPGQNLSLAADYVIGNGRDGQTFLSRLTSDEWIDLRISYYTRAHKWDYTPDQQPFVSVSQRPEGIHLTGARLISCLLCHSTVLRIGPNGPDIAHSHIGIGCERCHGPGRAHAEQGARMEDLSAASPARIMALCGSCHETAASQPAGLQSTEDQLPRLEGLALERSACYLQSKTLSCVTCHDPHVDTRSGSPQYEAICLRCHTAAHPATGPFPGAASPGIKVSAVPGKVCPVNPTHDCVRCHMPLQSMRNAPYTLYHNHWIKVWKKTA